MREVDRRILAPAEESRLELAQLVSRKIVWNVEDNVEWPLDRLIDPTLNLVRDALVPL